MSLIITLFVPEGIVLAGDSRLTLSWDDKNKDQVIRNSITCSDTNSKIFNIKNKFGLGTHGQASINGIPIAGFINTFIEEKIEETTEIDEIPQKLHDFFGKYELPSVNFYIVGYKTENGISAQHSYWINIDTKKTTQVNQNATGTFFGGHWGGEIDVLQRLIQNVKVHNGTAWEEINTPQIAWNYLTLQDAIDFCTYGINTTIETLRFQQRPKTVGGPIDVLVIRPSDGAKWVRKNELK